MTRLFHVTTIASSLLHLNGQLRHMRINGFDVHVVSSGSDLLRDIGTTHGVTTHAVEMSRSITPFRDLRSLIDLYRIFRRFKPEIVHAHTPKAGLLAMLAARAAGVPIRIYHIRGLRYVTALGWKRQVLRWSEKLACRLAHSVLCVSRSVREVAVEESLVPHGKIKVLNHGSHGVEAAGRFNPDSLNRSLRTDTRGKLEIPQQAVVVGFIGRLVRDKGLVELSDAWTLLREEFQHLHLLLVGPFEKEDPIPEKVKRALIEDPRVHLTGINLDTPPLLASMDIVCLPTFREGFPNVPLEAAAMRLPVVATNVPGCVDAVVDGQTGTLVPPRDSKQLALAVRSYIFNRDLRERHGRAARERVLRDFRPEAIWQAVYDEYMELLRIHGSSLSQHVESGETVSAEKKAA